VEYGVAPDAQGKIAWGRSDIGGDPIVEGWVRPLGIRIAR
jgi:hypothetical protein